MSFSLGGDACPASPAIQNNVRVWRAPAVISWIDDDKRPASLTHDPLNHNHVAFDIYVDHDSHAAFFKIIANVAYKGKRNKSNVYLFIYPERIQALASVDDDDSAAARLGMSAHSLQFNLDTPPSLVVPNGELVPKNEEAQSTISSLLALARVNIFRVALPSNSISLDRLAILCQEASTNGYLKTMTDVANVAKLYGGQGGRIMECSVDAKVPGPHSPGHIKEARSDECQTSESPPSYEQLDSGSSHPPGVKKRRRLDSDDAGSPSLEKISLEEICRHGFTEMGRRFDRIEKSLGDLNSRLDRMEHLVQEIHLREASPHWQEDHQQQHSLEKRIGGVEGRVTDVETRLEVGLQDLAQDVENQLYDVRHEFNDTISIRIDDEIGVAQGQLEDFVKDELRNVASDVEESVKETLRDALA